MQSGIQTVYESRKANIISVYKCIGLEQTYVGLQLHEQKYMYRIYAYISDSIYINALT